MPFPLKKWIVRSPPNPLVAEHSFPVCNAEEDDQKKVSGKSQSRLDLTAENFSNAIILNDILGKKNQNIKRKNPNNFYNFAVSIEEGKDDDLYRCGQSVVANEINGIDVLADKTPTDWEGNFVENKGVLAAQTSAGTTPTPTPTIFQREATVEVVNQVKTKSAVSSFADIFSSGFIKALLPKNLFSGLSNKDGAVKNRVVTNTGLESTEKDLNVVYPRAAEIEETAKVFREMLLPKAVQ